MGFNLDNYVPVSDRIDKFRADHASEFGLLSEVVFDDGKRIVVKATVTDATGRAIANGHAEEIRGQGNVNRTSALENAETSAWGRALAALGYDVQKGVASREEMQKVQAPAKRQPVNNTAAQADPETGEKLHNLTRIMLDEIAATERPGFTQALQKAHNVPIGKVPESLVPTVEKLIAEYAAGRPFDEAAP